MSRLLGLTLHRPWARFVANGQKRIENRSWAPPKDMLGQTIAIHAGKKWDDEGAEYCEEVLGVRTFDDRAILHPEGIIGLAKIIGWSDFNTTRGPHNVVGIEATILHSDGRKPSFTEEAINFSSRDLEWCFGPVTWVLREQVLLSAPVPCRGMQKLWNVPADVETKVRAQLALTPVQAFLPCPACNKTHVDEGEWATRPHHEHLCANCGETWRIDLAQPHHSTYAVGVAP